MKLLLTLTFGIFLATNGLASDFPVVPITETSTAAACYVSFDQALSGIMDEVRSKAEIDCKKRSKLGQLGPVSFKDIQISQTIDPNFCNGPSVTINFECYLYSN